MNVPMRALTLAAAGMVTLSACATKGYVNKRVDAQAVALDAERTARVQADEAQRADIQALRTDLHNLRTEFGAKITEVSQGLQFAFPVHFAFNDANVRTEDSAALDRFADVVSKHYNGAKVTVEGFADPAGTTSYNRALSMRRAEAVRAHLTTAGLSPELIDAIGYGETRQVVMGAERDDPGAEKNRRVVFVVESRGESTMAEANTLQ
jgi:peptidoglycan-associated lipoprotein